VPGPGGVATGDGVGVGVGCADGEAWAGSKGRVEGEGEGGGDDGVGVETVGVETDGVGVGVEADGDEIAEAAPEEALPQPAMTTMAKINPAAFAIEPSLMLIYPKSSNAGTEGWLRADTCSGGTAGRPLGCRSWRAAARLDREENSLRPMSFQSKAVLRGNARRLPSCRQ
jgi:hypothetical protein